jgi:hypothetical protein
MIRGIRNSKGRDYERELQFFMNLGIAAIALVAGAICGYAFALLAIREQIP